MSNCLPFCVLLSLLFFPPLNQKYSTALDEKMQSQIQGLHLITNIKSNWSVRPVKLKIGPVNEDNWYADRWTDVRQVWIDLFTVRIFIK